MWLSGDSLLHQPWVMSARMRVRACGRGSQSAPSRSPPLQRAWKSRAWFRKSDHSRCPQPPPPAQRPFPHVATSWEDGWPYPHPPGWGWEPGSCSWAVHPCLERAIKMFQSQTWDESHFSKSWEIVVWGVWFLRKKKKKNEKRILSLFQAVCTGQVGLILHLCAQHQGLCWSQEQLPRPLLSFCQVNQ